MKPVLLFAAALTIRLGAAEPPWNPATVKACDRSCLTEIMDRYTAALLQHDRSALPLADDVRFTENTALLNVGEGILWRAKIEPTAFKYYVADPVTGQVAIGTLVKVQERQLPNLQTPRPALLNDIAPSERTSREGMIAAANSYFDAIEGDSGKIGAFPDDCERHENG